ncbi:MAG: hypothetical protein AAF203_01375 [Pseudomonadota bacterium]
MSYLQQQMNTLKYDKRLLEMNIKKKNLTADEYKSHLDQLPDDAANAEKLQLESETEAPAAQETMNGDSHPAQGTPFNTDPFGSGF